MKISDQIQAPNKTLVCVNPGSLALTKGKSYRGYELGEYYRDIEDDRGGIINYVYKWSDELIFVSLDEQRQLRIEELGILRQTKNKKDMKIDYTSEEMMSASYQYDGMMDDGRKFVLHAEWNSWDDYTAEQIEWLDDAVGTYEEECEIMEEYQEKMNS